MIDGKICSHEFTNLFFRLFFATKTRRQIDFITALMKCDNHEFTNDRFLLFNFDF